MVILGGLELVAAGYVVHEYNKNKKEKRELQRIQQEEDDYQREQEEERRRRRQQRRRHSTSGDRPRPFRQGDYKYGYKPAGSPQSHHTAKPAAAVAGLYGATVASQPNGKHRYDGPSSTLNVPAGPVRPSSAPGVHHYNQRPGAPPAYAPSYVPPPSMQAHTYGPATGTQYYSPPQPNNYGPASHQNTAGYIPQQQMYPTVNQQNQGPWAPDYKYPLPPPSSNTQRRSSDTSTALGIYEPPPVTNPTNPHSYTAPPSGVYEMSSEGSWMHDDHRSGIQSPHVRFRLPGEHDRVVGTGDRSSIAVVGDAGLPPPAYRP